MNVEAIERLLVLVNLLQKASMAMGDVATIIKEAQDDHRDLSDDEINIVRQRTDEAIDELRSLR